VLIFGTEEKHEFTVRNTRYIAFHGSHFLTGAASCFDLLDLTLSIILWSAWRLPGVVSDGR